MAGPASSANSESAAVSSTSWACAWVMVLNVSMSRSLIWAESVTWIISRLSVNKTDFGHFANQFQTLDPLGRRKVRIQAVLGELLDCQGS
jgi:hypothetical protein